ncbi:MAG: ribosome maturation factor RimM [Gaiellales bacterium]
MTDAHPWRPARVRVGTIGKAHGLDGSFRVADPCGWWDFPTGSTVLVNGDPRTVARSRGDALAPLLALEGAGDRTAIELLRGAALELPRDAIPEPDADAYFRFDLVGCTVEHAEGTPLGVVEEVEDGVAHDQLVVGEHRIPFVAAIVPVVDIPARRMVLAGGWEPVAVE